MPEQHSSYDPETHVRAYSTAIEKAWREERIVARERTRMRLSMVPRAAMPITGIGILIIATFVMGTIWGLSTAMALQIGVVSAMAYAASNDVRISIVDDNPEWRQRHRVLARLFPRHPID